MSEFLVGEVDRTTKHSKNDLCTGYIGHLVIKWIMRDDVRVEVRKSLGGIDFIVGEKVLSLEYVSLLIEASIKSATINMRKGSSWKNSLSYFYSHLLAPYGIESNFKEYLGVEDWREELRHLYESEGISVKSVPYEMNITESSLSYLSTVIEDGRLLKSLDTSLLVREDNNTKARFFRGIIQEVLRPFAKTSYFTK